MKTPEARKLIGQRIKWDETRRDVGGWSMPWRYAGGGILEDVRGRNVLIDGDWKWLPDLRNFRLDSTPSPSNLTAS